MLTNKKTETGSPDKTLISPVMVSLDTTSVLSGCHCGLLWSVACLFHSMDYPNIFIFDPVGKSMTVIHVKRRIQTSLDVLGSVTKAQLILFSCATIPR